MKRLHLQPVRLTAHLLALLWLLLGAGGNASAQEYGIVDDVTVSSTAEGKQIRIRFNRAAQYLGHTPEKNGEALFIDLRLVGPGPTDILVPQQQQLRFRADKDSPLASITYNEDGNNRARLELGFRHAVTYRVSASNDFRGITVILPEEHKQQQPAVAPPEPKASPEVEKKAATLMNEARKTMLDERNFKRAITLYQAVLSLPRNSQSRTALELLGLAHERLGQRTKAKSIYERYLQQYPQGDGSDRVRQRLMSLQTATLPERMQLRKERAGGESSWDVYGSLSQFYLRNTYTVDNTATQTTASAVSTDLDLVAQRRSSNSDSRFRITAGNYNDLLPDNNKSSSRVSALYAEHHDRKIGWWARAGRQSSSRDGVLGKFDGLKLGYALGKKVQASIVAGSPVNSSRDSYDETRQLAGVSLDFGPFANSFEFSLYGIGQRTDSTLVDREAAGAELRYYKQNLMVLGLIDYDTFYDELNIGMLLANWTLKNDLTINTTIDVRKTPILTTQNALQGQTVTTIAELRKLYTDDTIYQLARDRTAEARTFTLGVSQPVSKTLRLAGDLTVMNTTATVASGGVPAMPATDDEYFLNLQMIGTGVLNGDDISSLGLRMSDTTTAQSIGLYASSRLPVGDRWRFYPRLRLDYREWKSTSQTQWSVGPVLRTEYRWGKVHFEAEYGGDWTSRTLPDSTEKTTSTYGSIGYRYEF